MEEKDTSKVNSSGSERKETQINALLQEMIKKETSPAPPKNDKTPLDNLKNILSQVDQGAVPAKEDSVKNATAISTVSAMKNENIGAVVSRASESGKKPVSLPGTDPVEKLNELIKAYRASKR